MRHARFHLILALLVLLLGACAPATSTGVVQTPASGPDVVATLSASTATAVDPTQFVEDENMTSVPTGDSRVASQRDLLFVRLDLRGEGANLRPAEPIIPPSEFGAVEAYAFEQEEPYVYHAFYLFESDETLSPAFSRWVMDEEASAYLPEGAELIAGSGSGNIAISYYFADGSRGDPDAALDALYEVTSRVGGNE